MYLAFIDSDTYFAERRILMGFVRLGPGDKASNTVADIDIRWDKETAVYHVPRIT